MRLDDAIAAPDVGEHVRLDVRLDGLGHWLHLLGAVVRVDVRRPGVVLAIQLITVPQDFEDVVQNKLLFDLESAQPPRILLVDGARGRRELLAIAFRATGCHVIEARSPLEAIAQLDQSRVRLGAVVIADTKPAFHAAALRRFLRDMYPDVPLLEMAKTLVDDAMLSQIDNLRHEQLQGCGVSTDDQLGLLTRRSLDRIAKAAAARTPPSSRASE